MKRTKILHDYHLANECNLTWRVYPWLESSSAASDFGIMTWPHVHVISFVATCKYYEGRNGGVFTLENWLKITNTCKVDSIGGWRISGIGSFVVWQIMAAPTALRNPIPSVCLSWVLAFAGVLGLHYSKLDFSHAMNG